MTVYFVHRSFKIGPSGKALKQFPHDTVLDWFLDIWAEFDGEPFEVVDERLVNTLGAGGWILGSYFFCLDEVGQTPPETFEEFQQRVQESFEDEEARCRSPHLLEMLSEIQGEDGAFSFFDQHYLEEAGGSAEYLLHEDWRLPTGSAKEPVTFEPEQETEALEPPGSESGTTYVVLLTKESKYPMEDLVPASRFDGVRLPGLARHLLSSVDGTQIWPAQLDHLTALFLQTPESIDPLEKAFLEAVQSEPNDEVSWAAWSDWQQDQTGESPGIRLIQHAFERVVRYPMDVLWHMPQREDLPTLDKLLRELEAKHEKLESTHSLFHVEEHMAQICLQGSKDPGRPHFEQWIFFDDLWASAHPTMANALLRFCCRWDVLTVD